KSPPSEKVHTLRAPGLIASEVVCLRLKFSVIIPMALFSKSLINSSLQIDFTGVPFLSGICAINSDKFICCRFTAHEGGETMKQHLRKEKINKVTPSCYFKKVSDCQWSLRTFD